MVSFLIDQVDLEVLRPMDREAFDFVGVKMPDYLGDLLLALSIHREFFEFNLDTLR